MWMYIREKRAGVGDIEYQEPAAWWRVQENCLRRSMGNIQQLNERQALELDWQTTCHYSLGAHLLLSLYQALGEEAISATLREIFLLYQAEWCPVTEEEIYQAFVGNTPPGLEEVSWPYTGASTRQPLRSRPRRSDAPTLHRR